MTLAARWAAPTRKSGMTVLGKVPKPINLPSQRLENNGLDPNLEIVPKGTLTWGSKPTQTPPNAWGSSSLTSKNDGSSSSPSHLNGRPSSGGGSRPSTAGSESLGSPNAWGPNSRPSSASGTFASSHLPVTTNRPRSAETRPGSSQLSRFADNASENVKGSIRTIDRSGSTSHGHGFTLSTGDFPTLGSEKSSESNSQRGHSSKGRPTSSSGKDTSQSEQGKSLAAGPGEVISPPKNQHVDILKTDEQQPHTGGAPFPMPSLPNEGQQPPPYPPNFHMPQQFDSWRAPPGHAPEGMWHRGAAPGGPYRPVGPHGSFPGEAFAYYDQFTRAQRLMMAIMVHDQILVLSVFAVERVRWAAPTRKSGMTVLGKVPKPINLPSQRLENNGLDPNLEIVPKGTLTWGSKPTQTPPNAWGSSSLTSKNDGSSSSPSHLNGRPSSGGGSRPSTAGSESLGSPNAWGPNSRPSSASGTFASSHLPVTTNRPRSAETRPGSSQLSRFADNASENVKGSIRTIDRSGSTSHGHGFTLSTGDFPTLGSEKSSESNSQRGHSSKGRPTSSSGKDTSQSEQGKSLAAGPGEVISPPKNQHVDILKTDEQQPHTGGAPFPMPSLPNEGQQPPPYPPNFHMPQQFDSWRAPPGHAPEGMWHRGAAPGGPYRPVGPHGSFPGEAFAYYGGIHEVEKNAQPAPPLLPRPDMNQADLNMRTDTGDAFGDRNRVLTNSVPDQRGPAGIDHPSAFDNAHSLPRNTVDGTLSKKFKEDNSGMLDQQPVIKKNAALIEKIESLNNKARNVDARNVPEQVASKEFKRLLGIDSKSDQVMKDVPPTAVVAGIGSTSNQMDSLPHITPVLQRSPNVPTDGTVVGPFHSQLAEFSKAGNHGDSNNDCAHRRGDSSRNSLHGPAKVRSANKFAGHGRGESSTTDPITDLGKNNQHDQPSEGASQPQPVLVADDMTASLDYESQRAKMRELAVQRAKKLQAEEEERIKNQKAKALAKLEELNRRSTVFQKKSIDTAVETDDGHNKKKVGLDVTAKIATSTAELREVAAPDSLTAHQPPNDQHSMVLVQPCSTTLSHGASVGKDPVNAASSSAGSIQSNMEHVVQKSVSQSHDTNVPKPKQGFRKRHVASEEKHPVEKPSIPVGSGNAKKSVESYLDTKTAVTTSHDDPPAPNKKGARHLRNKKKVEDAAVTQHPPVVFNEQNTSKVSSEPKSYTGGVIISSSIVPTEGLCNIIRRNTKYRKQSIKTSTSKKIRKHQHAVRPVEKPGNEGVSWAPVKQPEQNEQSDRAMLNSAVSDPTQLSGKSSNDGENITRIKRAEMERYVPKPLSKELQQQNVAPNLQLEKACVDNKSFYDNEAAEKSSDAKVDPITEPKKWEDKKASKGHRKSHPSWRRRNTSESASVAPNAVDQAENSQGSKDVQKCADHNQPIETDRQETKQLKSHADTAAENISATAETVPLPVSGVKEHSAANRQRRQHTKAQRNESKDREGRADIICQSATPAVDANSANQRNISRSDMKSSGAVSHSRAHWKPKSNSHSQGNNAVEGQVDSCGDTHEMNSTKGSDSTTHQDSSSKSIKKTDGTDGKDAHSEQDNLTQEDCKQNNETHTSAEQQQVNLPVRCQGYHNGRYNSGGAHRGRGYDAGRSSHGTNAERRRGGSHLEYQPVGSYKPRDFQQNPNVDERIEGPSSGPVFRQRGGRGRGARPAGHFVKRNPASTSTNTYQEE
ncbi:hypothetical protein PR202_gb23970 [Eleusine coracana subsp. coracana]|uniref:BAT2 N-terminal domain-containing protein n=1 Tax=Eleusine coracana subsp. coracana TaxID=191504 RepID=A0AAV5FLS1_ELECO|nr:hypothetical protein PR202_gb23970 [Eleusine coracana subsp. coracana]